MPRLPKTSIGALTGALVLLLSTAAGAQDVPKLAKDLSLPGQGGVSFKVPQWKESGKPTDTVAVLEHVADKGPSDGFTLLMLTVEAGPKGDGAIDWKAIAANIVGEAEKNGSTVTLELKGDYADAKEFRGQRMTGVVKAKDETLTVELLALVAKDKLVTVSALTPKTDDAAFKLVEAVAKTAALGK
jgi:hypothetical protein